MFRLVFAFAKWHHLLVPTRRCRVTVRDRDGGTHAVEVTASSVFEAASLALGAFRQEGWLDRLAPSVTFEVVVQLPPIEHIVPLAAVERWVASTARSPKERLAKDAARGTG